jgi:hypothetical protein
VWLSAAFGLVLGTGVLAGLASVGLYGLVAFAIASHSMTLSVATFLMFGLGRIAMTMAWTGYASGHRQRLEAYWPQVRGLAMVTAHLEIVLLLIIGIPLVL